MVKQTTSIRIEIDTWAKVKKLVIDEKTNLSDYVESLILNDLKKRDKNG